jgi:hypothetical protein
MAALEQRAYKQRGFRLLTCNYGASFCSLTFDIAAIANTIITPPNSTALLCQHRRQNQQRRVCCPVLEHCLPPEEEGGDVWCVVQCGVR